MPIPPLSDIQTAQERPDVVLLVMDTQRVKNMSCYGYGKSTTPNIDRIAGEGVLFENNFVPACWTLPSHSSMFTGLYPFTHRADMENAYLDDAYPTWAEIALQLGYRTAAFNPNEWIRAAQADRGFADYDSCFAPTNYDHGTHFTAECFDAWLKRYRGDDKPFFVFLNFGDPHLACRPKEPHLSRFLPDGVTPEEAMKLNQQPRRRTLGTQYWGEREWEILKGLNDGATATVDERVGTIYDLLNREGKLDNTLFIITSDHGDIYDEHDPLMAHVMTVYDNCLHTPLIIRMPERFEGGMRCASLVQAVDFLPTFLEMLDIPVEGPLAPIQGGSLLQSLKREIREFIYAEDPTPWNELERYKNQPDSNEVRQFHRCLKTIRTHEWKYIWSSRGEDELYYVKEDKDEQNNRYDTDYNIALEMQKRMQDWLWDKPIRHKAPGLNTSPMKPVSPETLRRMTIFNGSIPRGIR